MSDARYFHRRYSLPDGYAIEFSVAAPPAAGEVTNVSCEWDLIVWGRMCNKVPRGPFYIVWI